MITVYHNYLHVPGSLVWLYRARESGDFNRNHICITDNQENSGHKTTLKSYMHTCTCPHAWHHKSKVDTKSARSSLMVIRKALRHFPWSHTVELLHDRGAMLSFPPSMIEELCSPFLPPGLMQLLIRTPFLWYSMTFQNWVFGIVLTWLTYFVTICFKLSMYLTNLYMCTECNLIFIPVLSENYFLVDHNWYK